MKIKTIMKKRDIKLGIVAGIIILLFGLFSSTMAMANPSVNVVVYDDFNYTDVSDYFNKWFSYEFIPGFNIEPQAIQTRSFGGKLFASHAIYTIDG